MRRFLRCLVGPKQPPLPSRERALLQTAAVAVSDTYSLTREWLTGELEVDSAMVLCEIDSLVNEALLEMFALARLLP